MTWEYEFKRKGIEGIYTRTVIEDSYMVGGVKTISVEVNNNNSIYFLIKNKEGIFEYAKQQTTDTDPIINKEKKVNSFLYPIEIGTTWKEKKENLSFS